MYADFLLIYIESRRQIMKIKMNNNWINEEYQRGKW